MMGSEEQGIPEEVEFQCHCQPLSGCTTLFVRTAELTGKGLIRLRLRDGKWDSGTVYLDTDQRKQLAEMISPSEAADAARVAIDGPTIQRAVRILHGYPEDSVGMASLNEFEGMKRVLEAFARPVAIDRDAWETAKDRYGLALAVLSRFTPQDRLTTQAGRDALHAAMEATEDLDALVAPFLALAPSTSEDIDHGAE